MVKENLVGKPIDYPVLRELCGNIMRFGNEVLCTDGNETCPHIARESSIAPEDWAVTIAMVNAVKSCGKLK